MALVVISSKGDVCWGMRESVERAQGYSVQPVNLIVSLHKPVTPQNGKYKYDII
jgi:hypothetical protein